MKCPNCKTEYLEPRKFCRECGAQSALICGMCGQANHPLDKYCGGCARELRNDSETNSGRSKIESERKNVTVLFSDLSGYTTLSQKLDPEEVKEITNHIFRNISRIIVKYNGFVERVFGDEVLAFFGVPKCYEDHPLSAILATREIHNAVKIMSSAWEEKTGQAFRMHSGIDTGLIVTGNTVVAKALDGFSGQTINFASRLADMAGPDEILIGAKTYQNAGKHIIAEPVTPEVVGRNNYETEIYRLVDIRKLQGNFVLEPEQKMTHFVGRERELARLKHLFRQSQTGLPMAVSIVSKPGEGKSRILYEFRKVINNADVVHLEGRCLSFHSNTAYFPIVLLIKSYFNIRDIDDDSAIEKKIKKGLKLSNLYDTSTFSCILQLLSVKGNLSQGWRFSSEDFKNQIAHMVRQMIVNVSNKRSIIIAIEDLHWIDKSSEEQLALILKNLYDVKILVIFTYRIEYVPPWKDEILNFRIKLRPLNNRDSLTMARSLLGTKRIDSNLAGLIIEKTNGVPLFIEEFVRSLVERKKIMIKRSTGYLVGDRKNLEIPSAIKDIISARIDDLPEKFKEVLQTGSVAGKIFNYDLMKWVTGLPEEDLNISLSALIKHQFLYSVKFGGQLQYHFKHFLINEVAYSNLLVSRRREIHYKFAEAIEKYYARNIDQYYEILSYHYSRSANREKAYRYLILSGKKAILNYSNQEAFHFFKFAAEVLENSGTKEKRVEALKMTIIPMIRLGYPEGSLKILMHGAELSKALNDSKSLAKFYDVIGNYYTAKGGDPLLGIKYSEKCLEEVEKIEDIELIARVARGLCGSYIVVGEPMKSVQLVSRVIKLLELPKGKFDYLGGALHILPVLKALLAHSLGWLGNFDEARKWAEIASIECDHLENKYDQAYVHFLCGYLYMHLGDGKKDIEHFNRCINYCEAGKVILWLSLGWTGLGMGYFFVNDLNFAKKHILKGIKLQKETKIPYYLSFHMLAMGLVSYESDELNRSGYFFNNSLKLSQKFGEKWIEGISKVFLGNVYNLLSDKSFSFETAEASIQGGLKILEDRKILPWIAVGHLILGQFYTRNKLPNAAEHLSKAENLFSEMGMKYWLGRTEKAFKDLENKLN